MIAMKAVRLHQFGGPEVMKYEDVARPTPGAGEVLLHVRAAGVNPLDWKVRAGFFKDFIPHRLPLIPGWDVSGVVESTGAGVTRWQRGDEVYGRADPTRDGAYAEFIVVRESEIARKPRSLDHAQAAAIPVAGLTAWQSLFEAGGLARGQTVLIHAAAGGVGHLAVQLAKWKGARVIGTVSGRNAALVRELGADEVIDHVRRRFEHGAHEVDLVLDTIGGEVQQRSWKVLKRGGMLVSLVDPPLQGEAAWYNVRGAFPRIQPSASQLSELAALVDAGTLRPVVETLIPLPEARRAHEASQRGHTRGKIVLTVA